VWSGDRQVFWLIRGRLRPCPPAEGSFIGPFASAWRVDTFNHLGPVIVGTYPAVDTVDPYSTVSPYPIGGSPPPSTTSIFTFNAAANVYNAAVTQFNSGSLDRVAFNTDV
jgi:hypothetical protein